MNFSIIIPTLLLIVFSFGLGIFSLYTNPKSRVVQVWFLMSMAVAVWSSGYLLTSLQADQSSAFQTLRILYLGACFIPVLYFHFVTAFLFRNGRQKTLIIVGYALAVIFALLVLASNYIIKGARYLDGFGHYEDISYPGFLFFLAYFVFFVGLAIIFLVIDHRRNGGVRRRQIFYILLASLIGFIGGATNFVTDLTGIYPYGQWVAWLYPVLITYGIFIDEIKIKIKV